VRTDSTVSSNACFISGSEIWKCLTRRNAEGQAILLVDKHLEALMKLADRHAIIEKGQVVWTGTSAALAGRRPSRNATCRCEPRRRHCAPAAGRSRRRQRRHLALPESSKT